MKYLVWSIIFLLLPSTGFSQDDSTWDKLFKIDYRVIEDYDEYGDLWLPDFHEDVKALEGKEVILPGYIYPWEQTPKAQEILFSAYPMHACFFCGVGGPETVAAVKFKEPVSYTANYIKIKGKLQLNESDPNEMMYIVVDAEIVE